MSLFVLCKKKQKQQLEWQMEHLRLEWKEKELRCQNVREQGT